MPTTFETIRGYVRSLLGDNDPNIFQFSDDVLNSHIRLVILRIDNSGIQEDGNTENFTATLSNKNIALMIYYVAESVIVNVPDTFSYKTPVLSVVRRGGTRQLLSHFEEQLSVIEGGTFSVSEDQFIDAFIRGTERFINEFSAA